MACYPDYELSGGPHYYCDPPHQDAATFQALAGTFDFSFTGMDTLDYGEMLDQPVSALRSYFNDGIDAIRNYDWDSLQSFLDDGNLGAADTAFFQEAINNRGADFIATMEDALASMEGYSGDSTLEQAIETAGSGEPDPDPDPNPDQDPIPDTETEPEAFDLLSDIIAETQDNPEDLVSYLEENFDLTNSTQLEQKAPEIEASVGDHIVEFAEFVSQADSIAGLLSTPPKDFFPALNDAGQYFDIYADSSLHDVRAPVLDPKLVKDITKGVGAVTSIISATADIATGLSEGKSKGEVFTSAAGKYVVSVLSGEVGAVAGAAVAGLVTTTALPAAIVTVGVGLAVTAGLNYLGGEAIDVSVGWLFGSDTQQRISELSVEFANTTDGGVTPWTYDPDTGTGTLLDETNPDFFNAIVDALINGAPGLKIVLDGRSDEAVLGSDGADQVTLNAFAEAVALADGDDWVRVNAATGTVSGGNGDDHMIGSNNSDTLRGDLGDDSLQGGRGSDELFGLGGNDTIEGGKGADTIRGGRENDMLLGDNGKDLLLGQRNADYLDGGAHDDQLKGGGGGDTLIGGEGDDFLKGGTRNDVLDGGNGNDLLAGNAHNDRLIGGGGNDTLNAGGGNDTLTGGNGNDELKGGAGRDVFLFNELGGHDTITDFDLGSERLLLVDQKDEAAFHGFAFAGNDMDDLLAEFAQTNRDGVLLAFSDTHSLQLDGVRDLDALADALVWV